MMGGLTAALIVAVETLALFPLSDVASPASLGVVYLLGVLAMSSVWGAGLGVVTSVASAAAFNWFHLAPTGEFTIADGENWIALVVLLAAALVVASLADRVRQRAREAEQRGRQADLAAALARILLGAPDVPFALRPAAQQIADALGLPWCRLVLEAVGPDDGSAAIPLEHHERRLGTLLVPDDGADAVAEVRPTLEALLAAAVEREALTREVIETRALRRSDEIKTAVLRAVSHDLRSPLAAIVASAEALSSPSLDDPDRQELTAGVARESARLSRLIDKLLELSRLQAGTAAPRRDWCSLDEILREAARSVDAPGVSLKLMIDRDLPLIIADAGQLERAFANLLENAARHSDGLPISVRARVSGGRLLVRVVDQGPGIALADHERVFEPFFRADGARADGSGLGLAIVKGFVEANDGQVRVESLPGQGTSVVVVLPLPTRQPAESSPS